MSISTWHSYVKRVKPLGIKLDAQKDRPKPGEHALPDGIACGKKFNHSRQLSKRNGLWYLCIVEPFRRDALNCLSCVCVCVWVNAFCHKSLHMAHIFQIPYSPQWFYHRRWFDCTKDENRARMQNIKLTSCFRKCISLASSLILHFCFESFWYGSKDWCDKMPAVSSICSRLVRVEAEQYRHRAKQNGKCVMTTAAISEHESYSLEHIDNIQRTHQKCQMKCERSMTPSIIM